MSDDNASATPSPSGTATSATPSPSGTAASTTMKLLVDKASQRVVFAEAGKDVVDFIFGLLAMPVGAVASLLRAEDNGAAADALGCVANVYASVEQMDAAYMQGTAARYALLVNDSLPSGHSTWLLPATATSASAATAASTPAPGYNPYVWPWPPYHPSPPQYHPTPEPPPHRSRGVGLLQGTEPRDALLVNDSLPSGHSTRLLPATATTASTSAPGYNPYVWPRPPYHPTPAPPSHKSRGGVRLLPPPDGGLALLPPSLYRCLACHALGSPQGSRGFVQGMASYTVMDDLTVTPASNMSTVALLGRLGVKDLDALEERTVTVGRKECLEILKAWFKSKTVLTDVFLAEKNSSKTKKRARADDDMDDVDASPASYWR